MSLRTRYRIRDILFALMVALTVFNYVPKSYAHLGFAGWPLTHQLLVYPFLLGLVFSLYCHWKWRDVFAFDRPMAIFIVVYVLVTLLSALHGVWTYPYNHELATDPTVARKLAAFTHRMSALGMRGTAEDFVPYMYTVKETMQVALRTFYTFGLVYIVYSWYRQAPREGLKAFIWGVVASSVIFIIVGLLNVLHLLNVAWATELMRHLTPLYLDVKDAGEWWPPLFWPKQVRAVFPEPSHVGNYLAYVLPIFWVACLKQKFFSISRPVAYVALVLMSYLIFMSQARTPIALYLGSLFVLIVLLLWQWRLRYIKEIASFIVVGFLSIGLAVATINEARVFVNATGSVDGSQSEYYRVDNLSGMSSMFATYTESNIGSIKSTKERSNAPRLELIKTGLSIFEQHPLLGIGPELTTGYYVKTWERTKPNVYEINMWLELSKKNGFTSNEVNAMNQYVQSLMTTGIVGTAVFLWPFAYIFYLIGKDLIRRRRDEDEGKLLPIWAMTSLVTALVSGANGGFHIVYGIWLLLPILYGLWYKKDS